MTPIPRRAARFRPFVFALLVLLLAAADATGQSRTNSVKKLARALDAAMDAPEFENAWWGVYVADASSGDVVYTRNADLSMIPASNTKLYSTSAALDQLGPDWTYQTDLFALGAVRDSVLEGNLVVRGSGDPVIGGRFNEGDITAVFRQWADSLRAAGVRTVRGDIIGDDNLFDDVPLGYGWSWDDEAYWYSAEISALSLNDNNVDIRLEGTTQGAPASLSWEPLGTNFVRFHNGSLTTSPEGRIREGYQRMRGSNHIEIASEVPAGAVELESLTIANPTLFFVHVLQEVLMEQGIAVLGGPRDIDALPIKPSYAAPEARRIARHTSAPLSDIVSVINKRSQNLYAEQVLKTLGATLPDSLSESEPGSAAMGWAAATRTLARADVDTSRIQLVDGSGLARQNLVTARMTGRLLGYMWHHDDPAIREAFIASLPIGGVDGSLSGRFAAGSAKANVRAKTGTVGNASALSGFVRTQTGRELIFAIMCNHFTTPTSRVRAAQDLMVETLARHTR